MQLKIWAVSVTLLHPPFLLNSAGAADAQATQDLTPGLQQDGSSQQQRFFSCAQHGLHSILFKMQVCICHPSVQDTDSRTQPLAHSSLCTAHVCCWATQPKSPFSTACAGGSAYVKEITQPMATFRLHLIKINHSNLSIEIKVLINLWDLKNSSYTRAPFIVLHMTATINEHEEYQANL